MNLCEPALLSLHGIGKRFGDVAALVDVDLEFRAGEVHAVLGENGAGKSTLMNAIYGLVQVDSGAMRLCGEPLRVRDPADARRAGIGMVHQEFALVEALSATDNLALGLGGDARLLLDRRAVAAAATRLAAEVGLHIGDLTVPVGTLPVGVRQRIEIVRALAGNTRLLILDEPTSVLTPVETAQLFTVLERLRARAAAVVFITHKLAEVMAICDRVTVMRRGRVVAQRRKEELTEAELARLMVGDLPPSGTRRPRRPEREGPPRLSIDRLSATDERGRPVLCELSLEIRAGEVFGVAGIDGNGQSELFEVLTGLRSPSSGELAVAGAALTEFDPAAAIAAGIGNIPPDRQRQGAVSQMTVQENAVLNIGLLRRAARGPFVRRRASRRMARDLVERYAIVSPGLDAPASGLSGGNLQRLIVGRALAAEPRVLVAFNPTRGLDIAATRAVHSTFRQVLDGGTAVLLISTDLDEILALSDRMAVICRGWLSEILPRPFPTQRIGLLMAGGDAT